MDCVVHGVTKSWIRLSDFHFHWELRYQHAAKKMCFAECGTCVPLLLKKINPMNWLTLIFMFIRKQI